MTVDPMRLARKHLRGRHDAILEYSAPSTRDYAAVVATIQAARLSAIVGTGMGMWSGWHGGVQLEGWFKTRDAALAEVRTARAGARGGR